MIARKGKPIQYCHDEDIAQVLKYVMLKIGIRAQSLPDELAKLVLLSHIKTYYPNITPNEIALAFDLAINEELDISPDDIKPYGDFNCLYLAKIMNAYLIWAKEQDKFSPVPPPPQRIYTEEEIDNSHRQWTEEFYQQIRRGQMNTVPDYCKPILVKDGLMDQKDSVVNFFVQRLGKMAEHIYAKAE